MKLLLAIIILFIIIFVGYKIIANLIKEEDVLLIDMKSMKVDEAKAWLNENKVSSKIEYEYNDSVDKDNIISQSVDSGTNIKEIDNVSLIVSLGKRDKDKLKRDGINELGKVPVMMYHGIVDKSNSDTPYTGGNVDKDG